MFPGKERHFLRAQLARIFHSTSICPKGLYEIDEDTQAVKVAEEFSYPPAEELKQEENWGNSLPGILKNGRTEHVAPADLDEGAVEEWIAAQEEKEKKEDRFRGINEHTGLPGTALTPESEGGEKKAWISRIVGDT
jgi:hypothetical protein